MVTILTLPLAGEQEGYAACKKRAPIIPNPKVLFQESDPTWSTIPVKPVKQNLKKKQKGTNFVLYL